MKKTKEIECLLCKKKAMLMAEDVKGYKEPDIYSIYHCPYCNTSFSMPRGDATEIYELIYRNGDKIPSYERYCQYARDIINQENPFFWLSNKEESYWGPYHAIKEILKTPLSAKILEVGSGLGYFSYALRKEGYCNAVGLDISQEAVDRANERYGKFYLCADVNEYAKANSNLYDIIILTEVIEHIEEPIPFISSLLSMLKESGHIIMTTPNKSLYASNAVWVTDQPPVHCWWFSEDSFDYIARKLNAKVSFLDWSQYNAAHKKVIDTESLHTKMDFIFNENGSVNDSYDVKYGILPMWIKKTFIYKSIYKKIYPLLFRKKYIKPKDKSPIQCVILSKEK